MVLLDWYKAVLKQSKRLKDMKYFYEYDSFLKYIINVYKVIWIMKTIDCNHIAMFLLWVTQSDWPYSI